MTSMTVILLYLDWFIKDVRENRIYDDIIIS